VTPGNIVNAAPQPLAAVRDTVIHDFRADRAERAARQIAAGITALVNKGTPLAQAMAAAKVPLPPAKTLTVSRQQIPPNARGAEPVVLMFTMAEHSAKLLEAPNQSGWFVISLDKIERGDASKRPDIVANTSSDLAKVMVNEYAQQFAKAVRGVVGVKKNDAAIRQLKAELLGQGGSDQP
jgi:peptidyl-prolyl cis-trans isomerase D